MKAIDYRFIYFLGIGGIGMSALARYYKHHKIEVAGYDKTSSALTKELEAEGIHVHYNEQPELLEELLKPYAKNETLIVFTPAVPIDHLEYLFLKNNNYHIKKRAEVLGEISSSFKTIAVAGTHGKTTTSTLIAHILRTAKLNTYAFLGGISNNYNSNLLLGNDEDQKNAFVVIEADEYDRSFLTLFPFAAVITSVDPDHLDIYGNTKNMLETYRTFASQVKEDGVLLVKKTVDNELLLNLKRLSYAVSLSADYLATNVQVTNATFFFDIEYPGGSERHIELGIPGMHNVENATAAFGICHQLGIEPSIICEALRSFKGVKRRFDYRVKRKDLIYIDDYAHHPAELHAAISAARRLYPGKKISGIFQPHLFTRTRDFAQGFADSLDLLDEIVLLEIYPARELPIEGISSSMLLGLMNAENKKVMNKMEVLSYFEKNKPEVLLTLGAGDIDMLVEPLEKLLNARD